MSVIYLLVLSDMWLIAITLLSCLSYFTGLRAVLRGNYRPNIYSRIIWLLLAVNSFVGLLRLDSSRGVIILSSIQTLGSLAILLAALKHSVIKFGVVEFVSTGLLLLSGGVWLLGDYPAINVAISLIAHFIGALPTLVRVIKRPRSENTMFWAYFAVASLIALVTADTSAFRNYMFPLYFGCFNLTIVLLSRRPTRR